VWVLFGVAAGAIGAWLADVRLPSAASVGNAGRAMAGRWQVAGRALLAVVVVAASLYGVLALTDHVTSESSIARVDDPPPDSLACVSSTQPDEAGAITWLDAREGQPNIVSAPGCYCNGEDALSTYHWVNAPSSLTGVPTVVGWDHELGYRDKADYFERVEDVRTIYQGSPKQRVRALKKYNVRYIYVGPNERAAYGTVDFGGLRGVGVAKKWDTVTIYRVNQEKLST